MSEQGWGELRDGGTEFYNEGVLPADVACPVCGTTGLSIRSHYREPAAPFPFRAKAVSTRNELVPCGHLLAHWEWRRETPEGPVKWTLVPL